MELLLDSEVVTYQASFSGTLERCRDLALISAGKDQRASIAGRVGKQLVRTYVDSCHVLLKRSL
jgi:hypothetical protein